MKALVITAAHYNQAELFTILDKLSDMDIDWDIVAAAYTIQSERGSPERFSPDYHLNDFDVTTVPNYCAILFTSGNTKDTNYLWYSEKIKQITEYAAELKIVMGGICCAAPCIRHVAKGRRVTGFPLSKVVMLLKASGAILTGRSIEVDDFLVTAESEPMALDWMNAVIARIRGEEVHLATDNANTYFTFWQGVAESPLPEIRTPFYSGFAGSARSESLALMKQHTTGPNVCVAFAGAGKQISVLAEEEMEITSFDTMYYPAAIIEGIYTRTVADIPDLSTMQTRRGWTYKARPLGMDGRCAEFIDTVVNSQSDYALAALGTAMIRCTVKARFDAWVADIGQLRDAYETSLMRNRRWLNLPGTFHHHHLDIFGDTAQAVIDAKEWDTLIIDPPKIIGESDIYSVRYGKFDSCLTQKTVELPPWTYEGYLERMSNLLQKNWRRCIFLYTTGVSPTTDEIEDLLHREGEIVTRHRVHHVNRQDLFYVIERRGG